MNILSTIQSYLNSVLLSRSENTAQTYHWAMEAYISVLNANGVDVEKDDVSTLPEKSISWFAKHLKHYSISTEQLYLTVVAGYYDFISGENLSTPNLPRVRLLIRQRSRRPGVRLPQFPRNEIEKIVEYAINLVSASASNESERLRNLRDRAFLLALADTGLRVNEACSLRRGDVDWNEGRAVIIGKGDKQAVVRFSRRCLAALRDYLNARAKLDGASGRPLPSLPLFARHDKGAGKKIKPITTTTGRNIVDQRVREALGGEAADAITPHSFRHFFVTTVLRGSGGNLKLAQELARHKNIAVTQRYAHLSDDELDEGYADIFDQPK